MNLPLKQGILEQLVFDASHPCHLLNRKPGHLSKIVNAANPLLFFDTDSSLIDATNAIE